MTAIKKQIDERQVDVINLKKEIYFQYTGEVETFIVPATGYYKLECWGAEGGGRRLSGNSDSGLGGLGGYASGVLLLQKGEILYISVGGYGISSTNGSAAGGYNGGGSGYASSSGEPGNGGGGASDIRVVTNNLYNRIIVAGGGGGGGEDPSDSYGHGGGASGVGYSSYDATQTKAGDGGSFGYGGSTGRGDGGGGGGGWYGGGTKSSNTTGNDTQGGGGGSGYVLTEESYKPQNYFSNYQKYYMTNTVMLAGDQNMPSNKNSDKTMTGNQGNGCVRITTLGNTLAHYALVCNNKFYIPSLHYYNKEKKELIPVDKSELYDAHNLNYFIYNPKQLFAPLYDDSYAVDQLKEKEIKIAKILLNSFYIEHRNDTNASTNTIVVKHDYNKVMLAKAYIDIKITKNNNFKFNILNHLGTNNLMAAIVIDERIYGKSVKPLCSNEDILQYGINIKDLKDFNIPIDNFTIRLVFTNNREELQSITQLCFDLNKFQTIEDNYIDISANNECIYVAPLKSYKKILINRIENNDVNKIKDTIDCIY